MIYLDMDGVIVDLIRGIIGHYGMPEREDTWDIHTWYGKEEKGFWEDFESFDWWKNLHPFDGWKEFYKELLFLSDNQVMILSKPSKNPQSLAGKMDWLQNHISKGFKNYIFTAHKELLVKSSDDILIDDSDVNINKWEDAGGTGILCPRSYNNNRFMDSDTYGYVLEQLNNL